MHCVFYDTLPIIHPISRTFCFYSISFSISFSIYGTQSCVLLRSYSTFGWILPGCTPVLCPRSPLFFPFFFPYNIDVREILLMHCVFYDTLRLYDSILLQSRAHTAPILRTYCFNPAHILLQSRAHPASILHQSCTNPAHIPHHILRIFAVLLYLRSHLTAHLRNSRAFDFTPLFHPILFFISHYILVHLAFLFYYPIISLKHLSLLYMWAYLAHFHRIISH